MTLSNIRGSVRTFAVLMMGILVTACETYTERDIVSLHEQREGSESITVYNPTAKQNQTVVFATLYSQFILARQAAADKDPGSSEMIAYLDAGVAMSDQACREWFKRHNAQFEEFQRDQSLLNIIGDGALAIAGLADSSTTLMGVGAIVLGGLNSGYEVFAADFFLTPTIWKLQKKVDPARTTLAATMKTAAAGANGYSFFELQGALLAYHETCSRLHLLGLIAESTDLARIVPADRPSLQSQAEILRISTELFEVARDAEGRFSNQQMLDLYIIFFAPDLETQVETLLQNPFYASIKARIDGLDPLNKAKFENLLVRANVALDFASTVQETRNANEEPEPEPAPPSGGGIQSVVTPPDKPVIFRSTSPGRPTITLRAVN